MRHLFASVALVLTVTSAVVAQTTVGISRIEYTAKCSSNGRYVAFTNPNGLHVVDWQTGQQWDIGSLKEAPSVSDDGRWVAYVDENDYHQIAYVEDVLTHTRTKVSGHYGVSTLCTDMTPE